MVIQKGANMFIRNKAGNRTFNLSKAYEISVVEEYTESNELPRIQQAKQFTIRIFYDVKSSESEIVSEYEHEEEAMLVYDSIMNAMASGAYVISLYSEGQDYEVLLEEPEEVTI